MKNKIYSILFSLVLFGLGQLALGDKKNELFYDNTGVCASDGNIVSCGYTWCKGCGDVIPGLSHPNKIEVFDDGFSQVIAVYDSYGRHEFLRNGSHFSKPKTNGPEGFAERKDFTLWKRDGDFVCATTESRLLCTGSNQDFSVNVAVSHPKSLAFDGGKVCVIDASGLRCWHGGGKSIPVPLNIKNVGDVLIYNDVIFVTEKYGVQCWVNSEDIVFVTPSFASGKLKFGEKKEICAYDNHDSFCWRPEVVIGLKDDLFAGHSIDAFLQKLVDSSYKEKRLILKRAQALNKELPTWDLIHTSGSGPSPDTYMLLKFLSPLISKTNSEVMEGLLSALDQSLDRYKEPVFYDRKPYEIAAVLLITDIEVLLPYMADQNMQKQYAASLIEVKRLFNERNMSATISKLGQMAKDLSDFLQSTKSIPTLTGIINMAHQLELFLKAPLPYGI